jgi:hypothetical protein
MQMTGFWFVAPCSLVEVDRRFRGVAAFIIRAVSKLYSSLFVRDCCVTCKETGSAFVGWIQLVQESVHWQVLVNMRVKFGIRRGYVLTS